MGLPSIEAARAIALEFCQAPRQPHMITINREGVPRGRTLGATLKDDFTVEVWGRRANGRVKQVERNPNIVFVWSGGPAKAEGQAPQVVFVIGKARLASFEEFSAWHERRLAERPNSPKVSAEEAYEGQTVILFKADDIRLEGFAAEGESLTFAEITTGLSFKP